MTTLWPNVATVLAIAPPEPGPAESTRVSFGGHGGLKTEDLEYGATRTTTIHCRATIKEIGPGRNCLSFRF